MGINDEDVPATESAMDRGGEMYVLADDTKKAERKRVREERAEKARIEEEARARLAEEARFAVLAERERAVMTSIRAEHARALRVNAAASALRDNQETAGIPDSKPFIAPAEERLPNAAERLLTCHINGRLISDLNLDPQVLAALDYYATDEGVIERNSRPEVRPPSGVETGPDGWDKSLKQKRDDVIERGYDTYEARDPLREVADQYAQPGMRARFLSEKKTKDGGNRDYVVVKRENGDPVKVRGMVLGHIPERVATARNKHYQARGNQLLNQLNEKYKEEGGPTAVSDQ